MKRSLLILSLLALVLWGSVVGIELALNAVQEPPPGSPLALLALAQAVGQVVGFGLTIAAGVLGLIASAQRGQPGWLVVLLASAALSLGSIVVQIWIFLGPTGPRVIVTPLVALAFVSLVTLTYSLLMPSEGARYSPGNEGGG